MLGSTKWCCRWLTLSQCTRVLRRDAAMATLSQVRALVAVGAEGVHVPTVTAAHDDRRHHRHRRGVVSDDAPQDPDSTNAHDADAAGAYAPVDDHTAGGGGGGGGVSGGGGGGGKVKKGRGHQHHHRQQHHDA